VNHTPSSDHIRCLDVGAIASTNEILSRASKKQPNHIQKFTWTVVLFLLLALLGCGGGNASKSQSQQTSPAAQQAAAPTVRSSVPTNGANGVPPNESVAVTFDQDMDPATLTPATFTISGVGGTVAYDSTNKTAVFHPSATLASNTTYLVNLATGIKSAAGVQMAQSHSFTFATGVIADTTPPTIIATAPVNGATNVPLNSTISATFSEDMDPTGLSGSTTAGISASRTYDSSTHTSTLTPSAKLAPNTVYTILVPGTVKDLAGNPMGADYVWTFTTGAQ